MPTLKQLAEELIATRMNDEQRKRLAALDEAIDLCSAELSKIPGPGERNATSGTVSWTQYESVVRTLLMLARAWKKAIRDEVVQRMMSAPLDQKRRPGRPKGIPDSNKRKILDDFIRGKEAHQKKTGTPITDVGFCQILAAKTLGVLNRRKLAAFAAKDISAWRQKFGRPLRPRRGNQPGRKSEK